MRSPLGGKQQADNLARAPILGANDSKATSEEPNGAKKRPVRKAMDENQALWTLPKTGKQMQGNKQGANWDDKCQESFDTTTITTATSTTTTTTQNFKNDREWRTRAGDKNYINPNTTDRETNAKDAESKWELKITKKPTSNHPNRGKM